MKKHISILLLFFAISVSCNFGKHECDESMFDVSKKQSISISKDQSQGFVHSLKVTIIGDIDGQAFLKLMGEETHVVSGNFKVEWYGDFFRDNATIIYQPTSVTKGCLMVDYSFGSLDENYKNDS